MPRKKGYVKVHQEHVAKARQASLQVSLSRKIGTNAREMRDEIL